MEQLKEARKRGRGRLEKLSKETGVPIIDIVKDALSSEKSMNGAARKLEVSPNTIRYHLTRAGLTFRVRLIVEFIPLDKKGRE